MAKKAKPQVKTTTPSPLKEAIPAATQTLTKTTKKLQELQVFIDYPAQDEGIGLEGYSVRIGTTPGAEKVEISIDRGPWLPCRQAEGYWWYDWSNYGDGVHRLTARGLSAEGSSGISSQRRFQAVKK